MKKTRYIKPAVSVIQVSLSPLLLSASQEIRQGNRNFSSDDTTIDGDGDFI